MANKDNEQPTLGIATIRLVAPACDCEIVPGTDSKLSWLTGTKIEQTVTPEEAKDETTKLLAVLNGLARMEKPAHKNVAVGPTFVKNGHYHYFGPPLPFATSGVFVFGSFLAPVPPPPDDPAKARHRAGLVGDPDLVEIVRVFCDEINWQKLRVAFEKIRALVGGSDNSLVQRGYATRDELSRFKANIEDPRLSDNEAVHGVPKGPLKAQKMSEEEGLAFIIRLLDRYLGPDG